MTNETQDFEKFMKQREKVARAYVRGDAAPLGQIVASDSPATFFGPQGGYVEGAQQVATKYENDAASFESNGDSHFEILQMAANDGIGYWVGFQRATAHIKGNPEKVSFNLRITEVFRREGDDWKLVHRHADPQASEPKEKQK